MLVVNLVKKDALVPGLTESHHLIVRGNGTSTADPLSFVLRENRRGIEFIFVTIETRILFLERYVVPGMILFQSCAFPVYDIVFADLVRSAPSFFYSCTCHPFAMCEY